MATVYLGLGANIGDTRDTLTKAARLISSEIGPITGCSSLYSSSPLNPPDIPQLQQPEFLNAVVRCESSLTPDSLLAHTQRIEEQLGLERSKKIFYGPRPIDIDILFLDYTVVNSDKLTIPHPEIQNRDFVLVPLCEIAPELLHPVSQTTTLELLSCLNDSATKHFVTNKLPWEEVLRFLK
jgi:2-amino-4-hydroxy-6-hydroxymethyldihydropteridine diphosphokinase